jgi:hypothetical protein
MTRPAHRFVAAVTAVAMLGACSTQMGRIGADDGTDSCRQYVVQLDSTGNFFGEDIVAGAATGAIVGALLGLAVTGNARGAAIGAVAGGVTGAAGGYFNALQRQNQDQAALNNALANDLTRENAQIDRTQLAFNQLMDCRFKRAEEIRGAYRRGQLPAPVAQAQLTDIRGRIGRDLELARLIDQRIGGRGAEFDTAIDNVSPGTKDNVIAARRSAPVVTASSRAPVVLRLRPDRGAPETVSLPPQRTVQLRPAGGGFALVQTPDGQRLGYAEQDAFATRNARGGNVPVRLPPAPGEQLSQAAPGDVRQLAASNISRRDNFTESLQTAQAAAAGSGFELAG